MIIQPYGNPLAPQWMTPTPPDLCELPMQFPATLTVPANSSLLAQEIIIDGIGDFEWRSIEFDGSAALSGVRFRDENGRPFTDSYISPLDLQGPLPVPQFLPERSKIFVDGINNTGAQITQQVILCGALSTGQNRGAAALNLPDRPYIPLFRQYSTPPEGWYDRRSDHYFQVSVAAGTVTRGVFRFDSDADFYWRALAVTTVGTGECKWTLISPFRELLNDQNNPVPTPAIAGTGPNSRPVYPEIICPAASYLAYEITEFGGASSLTLNITLKGVKRFHV